MKIVSRCTRMDFRVVPPAHERVSLPPDVRSVSKITNGLTRSITSQSFSRFIERRRSMIETRISSLIFVRKKNSSSASDTYFNKFRNVRARRNEIRNASPIAVFWITIAAEFSIGRGGWETSWKGESSTKVHACMQIRDSVHGFFIFQGHSFPLQTLIKSSASALRRKTGEFHRPSHSSSTNVPFRRFASPLSLSLSLLLCALPIDLPSFSVVYNASLSRSRRTIHLRS